MLGPWAPPRTSESTCVITTRESGSFIPGYEDMLDAAAGGPRRVGPPPRPGDRRPRHRHGRARVTLSRRQAVGAHHRRRRRRGDAGASRGKRLGRRFTAIHGSFERVDLPALRRRHRVAGAAPLADAAPAACACSVASIARCARAACSSAPTATWRRPPRSAPPSAATGSRISSARTPPGRRAGYLRAWAKEDHYARLIDEDRHAGTRRIHRRHRLAPRLVRRRRRDEVRRAHGSRRSQGSRKSRWISSS